MKKKSKYEKTGYLDLLPGILLFVLFPLIAHEKIVATNLSTCAWYPNMPEQSDLFMYWKSVCFLGLAVWMLLVLFDRFLIRREQNFGWKKFLPLGGYLIVAILAAICSKEKTFAFHGMFEQYESLWVLLGYGITVCYFAVITKGGKWTILKNAFLIGVFFQCLLGISQLFGTDFWNTAAGKWILTGNAQAELAFSYAGDASHQVYMTFYHPNYAAVYIILALPVAVSGVFASQKKWYRGICTLLTVLLLLCLWGTGSRAGMIAAMLEGGLALVLLAGQKAAGHKAVKQKIVSQKPAGEKPAGNQTMRRWRLGLILLLIILLGMAIGKAKLFSDSNTEMTLFDVEAKENSISFFYEGVPQELNRENADTLVLKNMHFEGYTENGISYLNLYYKEMPLFFAKAEGMERYQFLTIFGKEAELQQAEAIGFSGREMLFSNRGYIWSRTLPLLKKTLLLGTGPDTFALNFPQYDTVARMNIGEELFYSIITKAHSMYLQTAVQTGILSLVFLLWFVVQVITGQMQVQKNNCIVVAVIGYLVMGIANDSMVAVAPFFWAMLGIVSASQNQNAS